MTDFVTSRATRIYLFLVAMVICGLAGSTVTAIKVAHFGKDFPFSNLIFSIFTYPIVDCICELWGKRAAMQAVWLGLISQLVIMLMIQASISFPHAEFWHMQDEYELVLGVTGRVMVASLLAFAVSQVLDVTVFAYLKRYSQGKQLWLRSNLSIYLGQVVDSAIFIAIIFYASVNKMQIFWGSVTVKIVLAACMTPVIYLLVYVVNYLLQDQTIAFSENDQPVYSSLT